MYYIFNAKNGMCILRCHTATLKEYANSSILHSWLFQFMLGSGNKEFLFGILHNVLALKNMQTGKTFYGCVHM